ncbi:UPF0481 protein At3g47200-like [Prosopis cineraria]|uniref:UPF0481 protein At3g47200-like n=1 Tax=Prosopis cineraria TaxID=364024 RepID=UPI00240F4301|nr:UPF0481 protein At3g47200-like [Prosopis cineraria]
MASHANSSASSNCYDIVEHIMIDIKTKPNEDLINATKCNNIYRVLCNLRKLNKDACTPQLVSIGPLHYGEKKLKPMQTHKLYYLDVFKERVKGNIGALHKSDDDVIMKQTWLNKIIQRDLLLLENQIPLVILEELYSSVVPASVNKRCKFIEVAYDYFKCFHPYKQDWAHPEPSSREVIDREKGLPSDVLRTVTKLRESGVSFEKIANPPLLGIKLEKVKILSWFLCLGCLPKSSYFKARLQIPQLKVDDTTECVLRNLRAFEQCHYSDQPYICNYVSLIDSLIHTKDDVELLVEKEVIVHELGSDKEVTTLVNSLCKHVVADKTCYKKIIDDLNEHYPRKWYRTMASLRLVYFRDAWRASSTLVGIVVLVFTIFNFCRVIKLVLYLDQRQPN